MEWLLIVGILLIAAYLLFFKKPLPSDPQDYAKKARTDVDSSVVGSYLEQFRSINTGRTIEARKQVATGLEDLHKKEGRARIAIKENDYQVLRNDLTFALEQLQHTNAETQIIEATKRKVSPLGSEMMIQEEHKTDETIRLKKQETDESIRLEREKSEIEIQKHKEMKDVDMEVYRFEKELDIKGAIIARIAPMYEVDLLTQNMAKALLERNDWLCMPESEIKKKMLKRLDKNIRLLNEAIDAKGKGLTQGTNRPELGAMDED